MGKFLAERAQQIARERIKLTSRLYPSIPPFAPHRDLPLLPLRLCELCTRPFRVELCTGVTSNILQKLVDLNPPRHRRRGAVPGNRQRGTGIGKTGGPLEFHRAKLRQGRGKRTHKCITRAGRIDRDDPRGGRDPLVTVWLRNETSPSPKRDDHHVDAESAAQGVQPILGQCLEFLFVEARSDPIAGLLQQVGQRTELGLVGNQNIDVRRAGRDRSRGASARG